MGPAHPLPQPLLSLRAEAGCGRDPGHRPSPGRPRAEGQRASPPAIPPETSLLSPALTAHRLLGQFLLLDPGGMRAGEALFSELGEHPAYSPLRDIKGLDLRPVVGRGLPLLGLNEIQGSRSRRTRDFRQLVGRWEESSVLL